MSDDNERERVIGAAAKRNHNTALQVLDLLKYSFGPDEVAMLPQEAQDRIKFLKEDAVAAEAEARRQLDAIRGWCPS